MGLMHARPEDARRGYQLSGDRVTDCCVPLCVCWVLNLGPLKEQTVFLTMKLSLQTLLFIH